MNLNLVSCALRNLDSNRGAFVLRELTDSHSEVPDMAKFGRSEQLHFAVQAQGG